jgi:hypothetical protein
MNTITKFDEKTLVTALKAITKSAINTRDKIQEVASYAIAVSITSGNVAVANSLLEALGTTKSLRKDSLVAHFEKLGNFAWLKQEKKLGFFLNAKHGCTDGVLTPEYESVIVGSKWDEAKREAEIVSEYDMEKQFRVFISRMDKIVSDPANTVENIDVLAAIRTVFNRIQAEKMLRAMDAEGNQAIKGMKVDQSVLDATAAQQAAFDAKQGTPLPVIEPMVKAA